MPPADGPAVAPAGADLGRLLPTRPDARSEIVERGLRWLVDNLDRPAAVADTCAQVGPALVGLGVPSERAEGLALLLVETLWAGSGAAWTSRQVAAWQETGRLIARWMADGAQGAGHRPPFWTGTIVEHDRRRQDLAVLRLRTVLPYPYAAGQYAPVAMDQARESWRPCWIGTAPAGDNRIELHVRAGPGDLVGFNLIGAEVGDRLRLGPAAGPVGWDPDDPDDPGALLLIAIDTGIAPVKAVLEELVRVRGGPAVRLVWLVAPNEEPYDLPAVRTFESRATVHLVHTVTELAELLNAAGWRDPSDPGDERVYVAGPSTGVAAALTALAFAGVPAARIRFADPGLDA